MALLSLLGLGCGGEYTEEGVEAIARTVVEDHRSRPGSGDLGGLFYSPPGPQLPATIDVYVDRSLSMRPYAITEATRFAALLEAFDDMIATEVSFYGFGFRRRGDEAQTVEATTASALARDPTGRSYTFANNDYAALIADLANDSTTHVIITDGVQSDPQGGARLGDVASALDAWVSRGGAFAVLLYRTPYRGQYYSDEAGPDPRYNCNDRPLLAYVLAPSARSIESLVTRLEETDIGPQHVVRTNGQALLVTPAAELLPEEGERRGQRVLARRTSYLPDEFDAINVVEVDPRAPDANGFVPLQFDVVALLDEDPWNGLSLEPSTSFLLDLEPTVEAWEVDRRAFERREAESTDAVIPVPVEYRPIGTPPVVTQQGDSLVARFTIPIRQPGEGGSRKDYALLVRFRPTESNARALIPDAYTTPSDLSPDACSRTLKLQRLVGTVMLRNYAPGQILLFTHWR